MNKFRRMAAELAATMVQLGFAVLLPDLFGTGDSDGDFSEAELQGWLGDLSAAIRWAASRGCPVSDLVAIRLGAALATAAGEQGLLPTVAHTVLWQPVFDGQRYLTQFLRLRTAASLMEERKESVAELRELLKAGIPVEVAGYRLSGRLAAQLDSLRLPSSLPECMGRPAWFELSGAENPSLSIATEQWLQAQRSKGRDVSSAVMRGEPIWVATEVTVNRSMIDATVAHILGPAGQS
jgi:exosortase A-associated hydrolase 2